MPQAEIGGEAKARISTKIGRLAGAADKKMPNGARLQEGRVGGESILRRKAAGCLILGGSNGPFTGAGGPARTLPSY